MEILHERLKSDVLTKISNFSNIMVYYGYIHEGAEFFRMLGKKSKKSWDDNEDAIVKVIMHKSGARFILTIKKPFNKNHVAYLLAHKHYTYYTLNITLAEQSHYKAGIKFIESLPVGFNNVFNEIVMEGREMNFKIIQQFMDVYVSSGFNIDVLKTVFQGYGFGNGVLRLWGFGRSIHNKIPFATSGILSKRLNKLIKRGYELIITSNIAVEDENFKDYDFIKFSVNLESISEILESNNEEYLSETGKIVGISPHMKINLTVIEQEYRKTFNEFIKKLPNVKTIVFDNSHIGFHYIFSYFLSEPLDSDAAEENGLTFDRIPEFEYSNKNCMPHKDIVLNENNIAIYLTFGTEISGIQVDEIHIESRSDFTTSHKNLLGFDMSKVEFKFKNPKIVDAKTLEMTDEVQQFCNFINDNEQSTMYRYSYVYKLFDACLIIPWEKKIIEPLLSSEKLEIYPKIWVNICNNLYPNNILLRVYNDFTAIRDSYVITIEREVNDEVFRTHIKDIEPNSIVSVTILKTYEFDMHMTENLLDIIFELNPIEIRIDPIISKIELIEYLAQKLKEYTKLRDLEGNVETQEQVGLILNAIQHQYMIKTVRILSEEAVNEDIISLAEKFKANRVAVEIGLNTKEKKFKASKNKNCETFYPD